MSWRKAANTLAKRSTLALVALILGLTAATALAANVTGDGTLVGSTGPDNITAGNGSDTIWGLGAPNGQADNISVGRGDDQIDAGGQCTGVGPGDYPNGLPQSGACEHGPTPPNCGTANITIGSGGRSGGNDTVYGNCGPNNISESPGQGNDHLYLFGGPNNVSVSNGNDIIDLSAETAGPNNITTGKGSDQVYAQNGQKDNVTCGSKATVVYVDKTGDTTKNCTVKTSPQPAWDLWRAKRGAAHRAKRAHKARPHKRARRNARR